MQIKANQLIFKWNVMILGWGKLFGNSKSLPHKVHRKLCSPMFPVIV